jgi:hypothetical protein
MHPKDKYLTEKPLALLLYFTVFFLKHYFFVSAGRRMGKEDTGSRWRIFWRGYTRPTVNRWAQAPGGGYFGEDT